VELPDTGNNAALRAVLMTVAEAWHRRITGEGMYDYQSRGLIRIYIDQMERDTLFRAGSARLEHRGRVVVPLYASQYHLRRHGDWGDLSSGILRLFAYALCEHRVKSALRVVEDAHARSKFLCPETCAHFSQETGSCLLYPEGSAFMRACRYREEIPPGTEKPRRAIFRSRGWIPAFLSLCSKVCGRYDENANGKLVSRTPAGTAGEGGWFRFDPDAFTVRKVYPEPVKRSVAPAGLTVRLGTGSVTVGATQEAVTHAKAVSRLHRWNEAPRRPSSPGRTA